MLRLDSVDHRYGRQPSLVGVSLELFPGDLYGFIGHNGAGKTTALRLALGLMRPRKGRVLVDGFDAGRHPREARARLGGLIETTGFFPAASGRENLYLLARLGGLGRRAARREADEKLERVGLSAAARKPAGAYSQGMRQRLGLAQALLGNPPYVLLDEPMNGLDPEGIATLRALLVELAGAGHAVLFSSHQLVEVADLCNRVGVLKEGRLLIEAETRELLARGDARAVLETDDLERTRALLTELGLSHEPRRDGRLRVGLDRISAPELVRALVGAGVGVLGLERRATSLEEIYLGLDRARAEEPARDPAPAGQPGRRRAPRRGLLRVLRYEARRALSRAPVPLFLALPAALAWIRIARLAQAHAGDLEAVRRGDLFSTSTVTAFEALARGLVAGLPVAALVVAALASQSLAGELSQGTLRNVLLRPLRRAEIAAGKALAVLGAAGLAFALLFVTAWLAAAARFDFGDRLEVFRSGEPELWITAADVRPYLPSLAALSFLGLCSYAALGFLFSAFLRRGLWALGLSLFAAGGLDLVRALARPGGWEAWLPSAYLPSPLGDTSITAFFLDLSIGSAEAFFEYEPTAVLVPCAWVAAAFLLAALRFSRRTVP